MADLYLSHPKFYVAVDCVIFGFEEKKLKLLLLKRNFEPAKGGWSLMGGFVQENESVDDAAHRVLAELTGLDEVYMDQVGAFGEVNREPDVRVISVAYFALLNIKTTDEKLLKAHNAEWADLHELPELVFDHQQMVDNALENLRRKATVHPLGLNLLPSLFTLTQLQKLYEAIYDRDFDKRNFRKRVSLMDFIEKTNKIDRISSKRGAALYRFNMKAYQKTPKFKLK